MLAQHAHLDKHLQEEHLSVQIATQDAHHAQLQT